MNNLSNILLMAKARAEAAQLPYAGALTPQEAYEVMQLTKNAILIDVRTRAELELVGRVPGAKHLEWAFYPGMTANPDFAKHLEMQEDKENLVIFMCRTGGRSHNAAVIAAKLGFTESYNMIEGFEGDSTPDTKQRCGINGWKKANLPWTNA